MENTKIVLSKFMHEPEAIERFTDILGSEKTAQAYVESVLILVAGDENLQACTPMSIYIAAKRAASLGLSCDKSLKQAWLIPYPRKIKATKDQPEHWIQEAQFQPHYKGLHTLAVRTNKYYIINVGPVYEGQRVLENQITGLHVVIQDGIATVPEAYNRAYAIPSQYAEWRDVTVRRDHDQNTIGWLAYFETRQGFKKSVYMSCEEIEQFARIHVKGYLDDQGKVKNPNWRDPNKRPVMEMKTVFRQLMGWADLSGKENQLLAEALKIDGNPDSDDTVDGETTNIKTLVEVEWGTVCTQADKLGIPYDANIKGLSDADLKERIDQLSIVVNDVKAQAQAGEEPQTEDKPKSAPAPTVPAPTKKPAQKPTESPQDVQIDPLSQEALKFACAKWGCTTAQASKQIKDNMLRLGPGSKFKNPMPKQAFKDAVEGFGK
jgi:recombinational DNA repair protein RecT